MSAEQFEVMVVGARFGGIGAAIQLTSVGASTSLNGKGYAMGVNNTRTSFAQLAMAP